jgi:hypothetical protein
MENKNIKMLSDSTRIRFSYDWPGGFGNLSKYYYEVKYSYKFFRKIRYYWQDVTYVFAGNYNSYEDMKSHLLRKVKEVAPFYGEETK